MRGEQFRSVCRSVLPHAVAMVILLAPFPWSIQVGPKLHVTPADPVVWFLAAAGVWTLGFRSSWTFFRPFLLFGGLFTGWTFLSAMKSDSPLRSAAEAVQTAEYLLVAAPLFTWALRESTSRRTVLTVFLLTVVCLGVWGGWQYLRSDIPSFEVGGPFSNRTVYGGFLAMGLAGLAAFGFEIPSFLRRIYIVVLIGAGLCTVLSGGALIAFGVAGACMACLRGPKNYLIWAILLLVWGLVLVPRLPRPNLEIARESVAIFNEDGEPTRRYAEWQAAVDMAVDHPLLGVGAGEYQRHIGAHYGVLPIEGGRPAEPDSQNLYLVLAGSIGIPGLLIFLGLLGTAIVRGIRAYWKIGLPLNRALCLGGVGMIVVFSIAAIWSPMLVRGIGLLLALGLAAVQSPMMEGTELRDG